MLEEEEEWIWVPFVSLNVFGCASLVGVSSITGGFPKSVIVRSEKYSDNSQNLIPSNPIGKSQIPIASEDELHY